MLPLPSRFEVQINSRRTEKPLVKILQVIIRDNIDFLHTLPNYVDKESTLFTFDVVNLYSNILHVLGVEANHRWAGERVGLYRTMLRQIT